MLIISTLKGSAWNQQQHLDGGIWSVQPWIQSESKLNKLRFGLCWTLTLIYSNNSIINMSNGDVLQFPADLYHPVHTPTCRQTQQAGCMSNRLTCPAEVCGCSPMSSFHVQPLRPQANVLLPQTFDEGGEKHHDLSADLSLSKHHINADTSLNTLCELQVVTVEGQQRQEELKTPPSERRTRVCGASTLDRSYRSDNSVNHRCKYLKSDEKTQFLQEPKWI